MEVLWGMVIIVTSPRSLRLRVILGQIKIFLHLSFVSLFSFRWSVTYVSHDYYPVLSAEVCCSGDTKPWITRLRAADENNRAFPPAGQGSTTGTARVDFKGGLPSLYGCWKSAVTGAPGTKPAQSELIAERRLRLYICTDIKPPVIAKLSPQVWSFARFE